MSDDLNQMFQSLALGGGDKKMTLKFLVYLDQPTLENAVRGLSLKVLFDCLNSSDEEQYELASNALSRMLDLIPITETLEMYGSQIHIALGHPASHVKKTLLAYLERNITAESLLALCTKHTNILIQVLECLVCEDRGIAEGSVALFKRVGKDPHGRQILFSQDFVTALKRIMIVNDITRFRIYEIVVDHCLASKDAVELAHQSEILPSLLNELKSSDTIIQLNVLELLTPLAASSYCLDYLEKQGCIQFLVQRILTMNDDPLSLILLPGFIEFFGHLFAAKPKDFSEKYPDVLSLFFDCFESVDPALQAVAINTLGHIGSSDEGKRVLVSHNNKVNKLFIKLGTILKCQNDLSIQAMGALCSLLMTADTALQSSCKTWFENMGPQAMDTIFQAARLPFPDPRFAALSVMNCLAKQPWGVEKICFAPGVLEFLMDRNFKLDTNGTHVTYEILQSVHKTSNIRELISGDLINALTQYVNEGPFYVRAEPQVSFMEGS